MLLCRTTTGHTKLFFALPDPHFNILKKFQAEKVQVETLQRKHKLNPSGHTAVTQRSSESASEITTVTQRSQRSSGTIQKLISYANTTTERGRELDTAPDYKFNVDFEQPDCDKPIEEPLEKVFEEVIKNAAADAAAVKKEVRNCKK